MMYIFYNPKNNKIMGASEDKKAMSFPYIESEQHFHSLDNLIIRNGKIEFKDGTLKPERMMKGIIKRRKLGLKKILKRWEAGELTEKDVLRIILIKLDN